MMNDYSDLDSLFKVGAPLDPLIHSLRAIRESAIEHAWTTVVDYRALHHGDMPAALVMSHELRNDLVGDVAKHPDPWTGAYAVNYVAGHLTWFGIPIEEEAGYPGMTARCGGLEALLVCADGQTELLHVRSFPPAIEVAVPTRVTLPISEAIGLDYVAQLYTTRVFRTAMVGRDVAVYKEGVA